MAIDLQQFYQVFFEESLEGLDIMESSLLELDSKEIDSELINAIFRCAHSIKGGSATFGFTEIAEFTHVLETFLDQVRSGERGLSQDDVNHLLRSVDCMREMIGLLQGGDNTSTPESNALQKTFSALLQIDKTEEKLEPSSMVADENSEVWEVTFTPHVHLFACGNDPLRNIQALYNMGSVDVQCIRHQLPEFVDLNPEYSYLSWVITLTTLHSEEEISEIFEWIEDDCDLSIENITRRSTEENCVESWSIQFFPGLDILRTGNEPARLINALSELGTVVVEANIENLPGFVSIDAENCYLSWDIELTSENATRESIDEVFEWVADESEITISHQKICEHLSRDTTGSNANTQSLEFSENSDNGFGNEYVEEKGKTVELSESVVSTTPKANVNKTTSGEKKAVAETSSIRVGIDKVDTLINMVGELVITQSMLGQLGAEFELERIPKLMEGLSQLEQNTRELQESVMKIRMLPISFVFSRFPRMVRDLGQSLGKSVELLMSGENTELDKTVMEKIGDPLVHLVRNAVDHGIETSDERVAAGKSPQGKIELNAYHQGGNVVIEIIDDGKGLAKEKIISKALENNLINENDVDTLSDENIYDLIFLPGFSTASTVSDVSGRGVGMDVVKRNIQSLNGVIEVKSLEGKGSKIIIRLPLTLAILDGQLVRVGSDTYIFPLVSIIESLQCRKELVSKVAGGCDVFKLREDYVPIIELYKAFSIVPESTNLENSLLVVVESDGEKVGVVVDELLGQQQVVIKSLEKNYRRVEGVSGATILGDGTVALIVDTPGIIKLSEKSASEKNLSLSSIVQQFESGNGATQQAISH